MENRKIGNLVSFDVGDKELDIVIKSMGTSKLKFERTDQDEETCFELCHEKIALTHKAFKNDLTEKLVHLIEKAGGRVES